MTAQIIDFPTGNARLALTSRDQERFDRIAEIVLDICSTNLDGEYLRVCGNVLGDLKPMRPFPLARGREEILAGAIVHLVGQRNGLFHAWFGPRMQAQEIAEHVGASMPSISNHSKRLRELLRIGDSEEDPRYLRTPFSVDPSSRSGAPSVDEQYELLLTQLPERAQMLSAVAEDVEQISRTQHGATDGADSELVDRLRSEAVATRELAAIASPSSDAVLLTADNAAAALQQAHEAIATNTAREMLGDELVDRIGSCTVGILELSTQLTLDELELHGITPTRSPSSPMATLGAQILQLLVDGFSWASDHAPDPYFDVTEVLRYDLLEWLAEHENPEVESQDFVSATICALESLSIEWEGMADDATSDACTDVRAAATSHAEHELVDASTFELAFDLGVMLHLSYAALDQLADEIGCARVRTTNPFAWLELLTDTGGSVAAPIGESIHPDEWLQLRVTLIDIAPPVVRVVRVPASITLAKLHDVLQDAMGWQDGHLHDYHLHDGRRVGMINDDALDVYPNLLDEHLVIAADAFRNRAPIVYRYDFGDCWEHLVTVEEVGIKTPNDRHPRLLAASRACPPEDCGGTGGYELMLASLADPHDDEHDSWMEWTDGGFDPDLVDARRFGGVLGRRR
jgi:hypothetical protein